MPAHRLFVTLLAAVAVIVAPAAAARDDNGLFTVKGVGALDCAAYVRTAKAGGQGLAQYSGYLAGYVSAYNEHQPDTFDLLPWQSMETLMLLMLRRCQQTPDLSFGVAVTQMARYFEASKLARQSERLRLGDDKGAIELYAPVVADVRDALARRGYPIADLYASLEQFRIDQQLPAAIDNLQTALLRLLLTKAKP